MTRPTDSAIARGRVKLWFFRDMTDDQRIALLKLFGFPANEMGTHGAQTHGLRHVFDALSAAEFEAESPAGTGCKVCGGAVYCMFCADRIRAMPTIPEKVTTTPERVQTPAESTHVRCNKCTASLPAGKTCGGTHCGLKETK